VLCYELLHPRYSRACSPAHHNKTMVFFSCEGCNETLKKNQVENHLRRASCGHYPVSCVDCSQVFHGVTYQAHTSCISEAEKYEKTLYKGPKAGGGGKGKKRNPQEEWMDMISAAAAEGVSVVGLSPSLRGQLPRMAELGNVPRNEKKFKNFLSNSLRVRLYRGCLYGWWEWKSGV